MNYINPLSLDLLYSTFISITACCMQFSYSAVTIKSKMPRRMGTQILYSSQEASQMIFMDTLSEGSDVDLAEDLDNSDLDFEPDIEPEEQDTELSSEEDENQSFQDETRKRSLSLTGPNAERGKYYMLNCNNLLEKGFMTVLLVVERINKVVMTIFR